jgi:hypothetical protein
MEPKKKFEDLTEEEISTFLKKLMKKKEKYIYDYEKQLKEKQLSKELPENKD